MREKEAENPFDYRCKDKFLIQWIPIENADRDREVVDLVINNNNKKTKITFFSFFSSSDFTFNLSSFPLGSVG
jgi:hypothetical protein